MMVSPRPGMETPPAKLSAAVPKNGLMEEPDL